MLAWLREAWRASLGVPPSAETGAADERPPQDAQAARAHWNAHWLSGLQWLDRHHAPANGRRNSATSRAIVDFTQLPAPGESLDALHQLAQRWRALSAEGQEHANHLVGEVAKHIPTPGPTGSGEEILARHRLMIAYGHPELNNCRSFWGRVAADQQDGATFGTIWASAMPASAELLPLVVRQLSQATRHWLSAPPLTPWILATLADTTPPQHQGLITSQLASWSGWEPLSDPTLARKLLTHPDRDVRLLGVRYYAPEASDAGQEARTASEARP